MSFCVCKECGVCFDEPDDLVEDYCNDCWVEIFDNDKVEEIYQNEEKCKNCNNGCLGCDYFENNIIPKIKKLKDSLKGDL